MFWSSEDRVRVPFHGTFSRHGRIKASFILLIWLNENVGFHPLFSSFVYRFIPTSLVSPFQFPCSSHFVPSLPAWFWDLMRIHWWLTEELPTSVCGRNVQCDEWFSLEPRCKGMKKNNRLFHLSTTCDGNVANLLHLPVYQYVTKPKIEH